MSICPIEPKPPLRTCLLILLILALDRCFILEQPAQSFFQYYPRFRSLCAAVKIHKVVWYMLHYGAKTPKRHFAWSNSDIVCRLNRGRLRGWKKAHSNQTVKHYIKNSKKKYVGTKNLKKTE